MRVVLDANVFVSSLIAGRGFPARIVGWWLAGEFDVLMTPPLLDELSRVVGYERIRRKYAGVRERGPAFVELIAKQALLIEAEARLGVVAADETDNRLIECALAGGAAAIVTGDAHLLALGEYRGIAVLTPAAFAALRESGWAGIR